MSGLQRVLRMFGRMKWCWDYANDKPIIEKEMTKEQRQASDIAKHKILKAEMGNPPPQSSSGVMGLGV